MIIFVTVSRISTNMSEVIVQSKLYSVKCVKFCRVNMSPYDFDIPKELISTVVVLMDCLQLVILGKQKKKPLSGV